MLPEGKRILWMVWALVVAQIAAGAVIIGLIGWTSSKVRADRAELIERERRLVQTSLQERQLALKAREAIERLLLDGPTESPDGQVIDNLEIVVERQLDLDLIVYRLQLLVPECSPCRACRQILNCPKSVLVHYSLLH